MIKNNVTNIESYDEDGTLVFTLKVFDEHTAELEIKTLITNYNIEEILEAIRDSLRMLELKY